MIGPILIFLLLCMFGSATVSFRQQKAYRSKHRNFSTSSRSICDYCKTRIKWIYVIPVFGYVFSKGVCPTCKGKIPVKYFLYEIVGGPLIGSILTLLLGFLIWLIWL